jgi:hypothetical protein
MKKCKVCLKEFEPTRPLQSVCSPKCAIKHVRFSKKIENEKIKERKEKLKSRSDWLREAQTVFNQFIRARDKGLSCISCGRNTGSKVNAGHYLAVGSHPELRFNELNNNLQCEHCNTYLSGNQIEYRKGLIAKIGIENVEWLEGKHEPKKYTVDEIKQIKEFYKNKLKELEK